VLIIACAMPLAWFIKDKPESQTPASGAGSPTPRALNPRGPSFAPVLRGWPLYLLLIASMGSIGAVGGVIQNLKLYLSLDLSYAQDKIAPILSLVLASSLAGRLLVGWLADRWPKKYVMLLTYSIVGSAIPFLFFADSQAVLYLFALVFGIGLGGEYMIIPLMAAELFGTAVLGRVMGIVLTADGAAEALAPMAVAAIRDRTGSYATGFLVLLVLAAIGAIAVALLPRGRAAGSKSGHEVKEGLPQLT